MKVGAIESKCVICGKDYYRSKIARFGGKRGTGKRGANATKTCSKICSRRYARVYQLIRTAIKSKFILTIRRQSR